MEMNEIENYNVADQCPSHGWRPIESAQYFRRKIPDLHAIKSDRPFKRDGGIRRTVDISSENMNIMAE